MTTKPIYLSMFWYGSTRTICSEHKTLKGAKKSAKKCEARGGLKHFFWKVRKVK
jgi:hypothetical protein